MGGSDTGVAHSKSLIGESPATFGDAGGDRFARGVRKYGRRRYGIEVASRQTCDGREERRNRGTADI